ncbi:DEAD/DEAH box helicase [Veillonellaceae bacterium M2-4]|nr:DEAD/DEAH box helicase [Veillonellaceae bacterium M2-4]
MQYKPHEYQKYATDFIIAHPVSAILLEMGLGKSVITLTAIKKLMLDSFEVSRTLVIAPLRVASTTWPEEIRKWEHLKHLTYSVVTGGEKKRLQALRTPAHIYIINRENVDWLVTKSGVPFHFDMVVIDELSGFKSYQAKRSKALLKVRPKVKRVVGLTGTPSSNGLMDLWAEFRILDLGERLGRYITQYRNTYFLPDKRNQQMIFSYKPKAGAEEAIYKKIGDITIAMKATDYLPMPDRIINKINIPLSATEQKRYDTLKREMAVSVKGKEIDAVNAAALSNKLLQMASGAVYDEEKRMIPVHDRKLDALEEVIEGANGKPVLVAYWYKHDLERIKKRFTVQEIKTKEDIADWNARKIPVAVIHPAAAGHGLNLQSGGCTLVWFSLTWSLELYEQTNARLYRQGQKETVVIHHLLAKGTIDEDVMNALAHKNKTQAALIDAVKANLTIS